MISILQKAWHIGTHESVLMAQTRCRNVTFRWVMKFSFRGTKFVKFKTFTDFSGNLVAFSTEQRSGD